MKCPQCGTSNGRTNKFCRGCGQRIEELTVRQDDLQASSGAGKSCPPDEVALGEELFDVWQHYSAGEFEAALAKLDKILACTPESASAHNILALIYEKQADAKFKAGAIDESKDLLRLATEQYERIIELNPDSSADREKLASLRAQIAGREPIPADVKPAGWRTTIMAIPVQVRVAFAAFLVVLMVTIIMIPGGGREKPTRTSSNGTRVEEVRQVSTPTPQPQPADATGLRIYTFPPAGNAPAASISTPTVPEPRQPSATTEPARLPAILGADVKIIPEPKATPKKTDSGSTTKAKAPVEPERPAAPQQQPSSTALGNSAFAQAIQLRAQGNTDDAISVIEQAISLFQADINAGKNVTEARRGIENARKLVQTWQEPTRGGER